MAVSPIIRSKEQDNLLIVQDEKIIVVNRVAFFTQLGVNKMLRLQPEDYHSLNKKTKYLTHFNLEQVDHYSGEIFALPLIVKPGNYTPEHEILPVLSFSGCSRARCISVRNNVDYSFLTAEDFKYG